MALTAHVASSLNEALELTPRQITDVIGAMNRVQKRGQGGSKYVKGSGADLLSIVNAMQGQ